MNPETQQRRSEVIRYAGTLTDWGGHALKTSIRRHLRVGNIVRIPVQPVSSKNNNNNNFSQTAYVRITEHIHGNLFRGVVEDPYYGTEDWFLVRNGESRVFRSDDVMELPLTWKGNENLQREAVFFPRRRTVTGAIM